MMVQRAADIDWTKLAGVATLGISAGASAPQVLVDEILAALRARYEVTLEVVRTTDEHIAFNVPRELRDTPAA